MLKIKILSIILALGLVIGFLPVNAAQIDDIPVYSFRYPMDDYVANSFENFGEHRGNDTWHLGNDISGPAGSKIFVIADGIVVHIDEHSRFGTVVLVEHELPDMSRVVSLYGHLRSSDIKVKQGQHINIGTQVGSLGTRGENGGWGEHLHLGIRKGAYVDADKDWVYWGLGEKSLLNDWYDPTKFIDEHLYVANPGKRILTGPGAIGSTHLRSFYVNGELAETNSRVMGESFKGGADVASGDFDGDGHEEIVFGAGPGTKPEVSIRDKENKKENSFMAYSEKSKMGIQVAAGDVDGDGKDEIITAPRKGGGGQVRIFESDGKARSLEFWPYGPNFKGGIDVAVAQVDKNTEKEEIIVAPMSGYKPLVKIFKPKWGNEIYSEFLAFAETFDGGVRLAGADVDKDGEDEIVVGAASKGGHVRVLEGKKGDPRGIDYYPFGAKFRSGVDVGALDFDNDGKDEIIIGSSGRSTAHFKVYRYNDQREILTSVQPYGEKFDGGSNVAGITF
ncbi:peptidoglycan DD-metalloendopeptidase family protein [Patescibacteria group bacterium]